MDKLKEFYRDKQMMNDVSKHFFDFLSKEIVREAFKGNNTSEYKKVKDIINKGFAELDILFADKKKPKNKEFDDAE